MLFIGIDISKASFDCALLIDNDYQCRQFKNDLKGFKALSQWLKPHNDSMLFCMEATGTYGIGLAKYLAKLNHSIIVVNPIKTHNFAKMEMLRNKTDKADAMSISRYCRHIFSGGDWQRHCFKPKGAGFERLQYLVTRLEQLNKFINQESNRLQVSQDKLTSKSIKSMLKHSKTQIIAIEKAIKLIIKNEPELNKQVTLLLTIQGIGDKTAWAILAYLGDIALFDNAKQVASFAGLNPKIQQSGTSLNRSSLSKSGNKRLRKALYMPAIVSMKHNPLMTDLYKRLQAKGKPNKLALCAVMRKLLVIAYGVLKSEKPFDVNYAK